VEEFLTTVILFSFNFALDVRDTLTHQRQAPLKYSRAPMYMKGELYPIMICTAEARDD
jgi:hypothetical protein